MAGEELELPWDQRLEYIFHPISARMKPLVVKYMIEAADMDRAVSFYRDILGFEAAIVSPYWSEMTLAGSVIGIHGGGDLSEKSTGISLQYEDVDAAYERALAGGASAVHAPESREGEPIILASIRDTEGNLLMMTQYVG